MIKADWNEAPDDAEWFAFMDFYKIDDCGVIRHFSKDDGAWLLARQSDLSKHKESITYQQKPKQWSESDENMNITEQNVNNAFVVKSKYNREIIGLDGTKTTIDVYRVLDAYKTDSPAIDHAIKKLLCAGIRHQKDRKQDLQEAIDSIAAELLLMSQR